jgi:hypothetical protein
MDCDAIEDSAITHKNAIEKERIDATWIPPTDENLFKDGRVIFVYTVAEDKLKFWKPQFSSVLEFSAQAQSSGNNGKSKLILIAIIAIPLALIGCFFMWKKNSKNQSDCDADNRKNVMSQ